MSLYEFAVWEDYGLEENPYFPYALDEDRLDLFAGESRKDLATKLSDFVVAGGSPLLLLEGAPGVGKTTLVNYSKAQLRSTQDFFIYPKRVEISSDSNRETLAAEFLAAMTTTALAAEPSVDWDDDPRWREAYETIADTWDTSGIGGGIQFAGFGANVTRTQVRKVAKHMSWEEWKALVSNILEAMKDHRRGFVLHLNNVDAVSDTNPEAVQSLFDESRDLLMLDGLNTIVCANERFRNEVIADRPRLLDVIQPLGNVGTLSSEEFIEAVQLRYKAFQSGDEDLIPPVTDEALEELYQVFEGDMRNTFRFAVSSVVQASRSSARTEPLEIADVMALMADDLEEEYESLGDNEKKIIDYLLRHGESPSQQQISDEMDVLQGTVSRASNRLEHKRWIYTDTEGKRRTYRLSGFGTLLGRARDSGG